MAGAGRAARRVSFGIWLERGEPAHAILGGVFLAGAANVKNEGLVFGAALVVALCAAAAFVRRPRALARPRAFAAAIVALVRCCPGSYG